MDSNDLTEPIPLGISGQDRLTWNHVNKLAKAINRRRGSVNPPSQVRNPAGGAAGIPLCFSARAAVTTTSNAHSGGTVDGVTIADGEVVADFQHATASLRGLFVWHSGVWTRIADDLTAGSFINVREGVYFANTIWILDTNDPIVIGTTGLTFSQISIPSRWTAVPGFTAAPLNSTTITIPTASVGGITVGIPIRYQKSGVFHYGICTIMSGTSLAIAGEDLTGITIQGVWYGNPEMVIVVEFIFPGLYAVSTGNILFTIARTNFSWRFGPAALCKVVCAVGVSGGNLSTFKARIGSGDVMATAVNCNGSSTFITPQSIVNSQSIDINIVATDTTDAYLTASFVFVLA